MRHAALLVLVLGLALPAAAAEPRARDLGIPFDFGTPGRWNAITDVPGVEVGHVTLVRGRRRPHRRDRGPAARQGRVGPDQCFGGCFSLNGNGEMTGTDWLEESGMLEGPVMITNTNSVGVVRDARHLLRRAPLGAEGLPGRCGRCPWWPRPGTGTSTTSTGCT